jgi:uncharacterized protein (DUF305 family)
MDRTALTLLATTLLAALGLATPVLAQSPAPASAAPAQPMQGMPGMAGMGASPFAPGMARMDHDMNVPPSGSIDVDFVRMMIPHHQGAIDMARIELAQGHDLQLKKLAREIIAAQEKEIVFMRAWLAHHPAPAK